MTNGDRGAKIFGVGLSRTGTSSLSEALRMLGYSTAHFPSGIEQITEHDAATDAPVAGLFRELDRAFPGSKFILTVRERGGWLRSCATHWSRYQAYIDETPGMADLYREVFGSSTYDEKIFSQAYQRHEAAVRSYFQGREADLLIMDICNGEGWDVLCPFLGKAIPRTLFPNANRSAAHDALVIRLLKVTEDPAWVSQATEVSEAYLDHLVKSPAYRSHDTSTPLVMDGGEEFILVLRQARDRLGGDAALAKALAVRVSDLQGL